MGLPYTQKGRTRHVHMGSASSLEAYLPRKGDNTAATVMMLDLDHFKAINDNYGHNTGDVALRQVAQILTSS